MRTSNLARFPLFLALLLSLLAPRSAFCDPAAKAPRFALVIGNATYSNLGRLKNPLNDARDLGDSLEALGFAVDRLEDADLAAMEEAVLRLRDRLAADPSAVGFFFYAGHGVQSQGENYLIPVDAKIASESLLRTRTLPLQFVLDSLGESRDALNLVVLDACRDNPFSWARSGSRGLAVVGSPPPGSIVAYATSAGSTARDGEGRNGVFTAELLKHIGEAGIDVAEVFRRTGAGVWSSTQGAQVPAVYSQYFGQLRLVEEESQASDGDYDFLPAFFEEASPQAKRAVALAAELGFDGKWLSAWKVLEEADPGNSDAFVLAEKTRLALDGWVEKTGIAGFAFVDLGEEMDLETARAEGAEGVERFDFDPHGAAAALASRGIETPPVLAAALGDYYYDIYTYGYDSWPSEAPDLLGLALERYDAAYEASILVDPPALGRYAELLVLAGRAGEAAEVLAWASEIDPEDAAVKMRRIDALVLAGRAPEAMAEAEALAAASPEGSAERKDARLKAAEIALQSASKAEFDRHRAALAADFPDAPEAGILALRWDLRSGEAAGARRTADELWKKRGPDSDLLGGILFAYIQDGPDKNEGLLFLGRALAQVKDDKAQAALLYLYRAAYRLNLASDAAAAQPAASAPAVAEALAEAFAEAAADLARAELSAKGLPDDQGKELRSMILELKDAIARTKEK